MIQIKLAYQLVHRWHQSSSISVIGNPFFEDEIIKEDTLATLFSSDDSVEIHLKKIQALNGHFSIIIESNDFILLAVDKMRTFPIFIKKTANSISISDSIFADECHFDDEQVEIFKRIYCTEGNNTLLKEWKQLQAGQYAIINKKEASIFIADYYQHKKNKKYTVKTANEYEIELQQLEAQLIDKIKKQTQKKNILLPLSGGYDSRYLLSLLLANNIENITCFTYGRKESYEVKTAEKICKTLQIKWHFIEYTNDLLSRFFTDEWEQYAQLNHAYSSLPHEQDFFALSYLKSKNLLPENPILLNGFCQDGIAGSIFEPIKQINVANYISNKYGVRIDTSETENTWDGYQHWFIQNRVSKFIINSVRVYAYFGIDFYLPFWENNWIQFWYNLPMSFKIQQTFYNQYIFKNWFEKYDIAYHKPSFDTTLKYYAIKKFAKKYLPKKITKFIQNKNSQDINKDANNTLFLYNDIYNKLNDTSISKNYKINDIHALYLLQQLKQAFQIK